MNDDPELPPRRVWLTRPQVAEHLSVSLRTVDTYTKERGLPAHKRAGVVRFDLAEVDAWLLGGVPSAPTERERPTTVRRPTRPADGPTAANPELSPECAFILMPDPSTVGWDWQALARATLDYIGENLPGYRWVVEHRVDEIPAGSLAVQVGHALSHGFGRRVATGVPVYRVTPERELERLFIGGVGEEARLATVGLEATIKFYEDRSLDPNPTYAELMRLMGNVARTSLALLCARWEEGNDEGVDSWRDALTRFEATQAAMDARFEAAS